MVKVNISVTCTLILAWNRILFVGNPYHAIGASAAHDYACDNTSVVYIGAYLENKAKIAYGPETDCVTRCFLQARPTCTAINTVPWFRRLYNTLETGRRKRVIAYTCFNSIGNSLKSAMPQIPGRNSQELLSSRRKFLGVHRIFNFSFFFWLWL